YQHGAHAPAQHLREARRSGSRAGRLDGDRARLDLASAPGGGQWAAHEHAGSLLRAVDFQAPVEQLRPLTHAGETKVAGLSGAKRVGLVEALAVVRHPQLDL